MSTNSPRLDEFIKQEIAAFGPLSRRAGEAAIDLVAHRAGAKELRAKLTSAIVKVEALPHLAQPKESQDLMTEALTVLLDFVQPHIPREEWPTLGRAVKAVSIAHYGALVAKAGDDARDRERLQAATAVALMQEKLKNVEHAIPSLEKWVAAEQRTAPKPPVAMAQPQPVAPPAVDMVAIAKIFRDSMPDIKVDLPNPAPVNVTINNTETEMQRAISAWLAEAQDGDVFRVRKNDDESMQLEQISE